MVAIDQSARRQGRSAKTIPDTSNNGVTGTHKLALPLMGYLIALMPPIGFAVAGIQLGPVRLLLLFLTPYLVANLLAGKYGKLRAIDGLLFAFLIWQGVAIGFWHGTQAIQFVGSVGMEMVGGYLVGRAFVRNVQDFEGLARFYGLCVLVTVPFALIESLTDQRLIIDIFDKVPGTYVPRHATNEQRLGLYRAQVNFQHPIHYGIFCALAFSMSFVIVKHYTSPAWGWFRSIAIGFGSFFSLSSGGFLILLLQMMLLGWKWITRGMSKPWLVLVILSAIFYIGIDLFSDRSAFKVILTAAAFSAHNAYWRIILFDYAMQNVANSPLVGVGLNDWERPAWILHPSLDNFFAYVTLVYGIPAFIFLAGSWLLGLGKIMALPLTDADPALRRCRLSWTLTMVAIILALCTVHVWGKVYSLVFFFFGTGMWLLDAEPTSNTDTPTETKSSGRSSTRKQKTPSTKDAAIVSDAAPDTQLTSRYTRFPRKDRDTARSRRARR